MYSQICGQGRFGRDDIEVKSAGLGGNHSDILGRVFQRGQEVGRSGPGYSRTIKEVSVAGAEGEGRAVAVRAEVRGWD